MIAPSIFMIATEQIIARGTYTSEPVHARRVKLLPPNRATYLVQMSAPLLQPDETISAHLVHLPFPPEVVQLGPGPDPPDVPRRLRGWNPLGQKEPCLKGSRGVGFLDSDVPRMSHAPTLTGLVWGPQDPKKCGQAVYNPIRFGRFANYVIPTSSARARQCRGWGTARPAGGSGLRCGQGVGGRVRIRPSRAHRIWARKQELPRGRPALPVQFIGEYWPGP